MTDALERWLGTHPILFGQLSVLVVWLVPTVIYWLGRPHTPEQYDAMPPRLAKFFKLVGAVFGNLPYAAHVLRTPSIPAPAYRAARTVSPPQGPPAPVVVPLPPRTPEIGDEEVTMDYSVKPPPLPPKEPPKP